MKIQTLPILPGSAAGAAALNNQWQLEDHCTYHWQSILKGSYPLISIGFTSALNNRYPRKLHKKGENNHRHAPPSNTSMSVDICYGFLCLVPLDKHLWAWWIHGSSEKTLIVWWLQVTLTWYFCVFSSFPILQVKLLQPRIFIRSSHIVEPLRHHVAEPVLSHLPHDLHILETVQPV